MNAAHPSRLAAQPPLAETEELDDDDVGADGFEPDDADGDGPDLLAEETGIDLTDASELDADNVPADEEHDRVLQAPD